YRRRYSSNVGGSPRLPYHAACSSRLGPRFASHAFQVSSAFGSARGRYRQMSKRKPSSGSAGSVQRFGLILIGGHPQPAAAGKKAARTVGMRWSVLTHQLPHAEEALSRLVQRLIALRPHEAHLGAAEFFRRIEAAPRHAGDAELSHELADEVDVVRTA